ncbi:MAG: nitronate monooxygenase [Clostridia bacterium]|nr:nitronate monooxygenase [Clostridia bacterium]
MKNRVCEILGIEKPIIQGPMNWLTDGKFVGAVSRAGGLGVLGFNAGQKKAVFTVEETIANMRREVAIVKSMTDKPFGINIGPTDPAKDRFTLPMLDMMQEEGIHAAVWASMTFDEFWVKACHDRGIKIVYRAHTPTAEDTERAIQAGVDIIVATGFDEGGTVPNKVVGTFSVVPMIVDAAKGRVPVMACGGIADERTAQAAFVLGAEGLFVGTAFLLSEESVAAANIKEMAVKADADDLLMYRTIPSFYRSLPGELPNKLLEMSKAGATEEEIYQAQHAYDGMRDGMLFGDLSMGYASFGLGISMIHAVEPVSVIMDRLMRGVNAAQKAEL